MVVVGTGVVVAGLVVVGTGVVVAGLVVVDAVAGLVVVGAGVVVAGLVVIVDILGILNNAPSFIDTLSMKNDNERTANIIKINEIAVIFNSILLYSICGKNKYFKIITKLIVFL